MMPDLLKDWWPLLMLVVGAIVSHVRLESRSNTNARDAMRLREDMIAMEKRILQQRAEDMEARHRDWAEMKSELSEMKRDIKVMLQHVSK